MGVVVREGLGPSAVLREHGTPSSPATFDSEPPVDAEKRERLLKKVVTEEVLAGATVVHQDRFFAIFSVRKKVRHVQHALLSILTLGLWTTVWIVLTIARREDRFRVDIDPWGNAWAQEATGS